MQDKILNTNKTFPKQVKWQSMSEASEMLFIIVKRHNGLYHYNGVYYVTSSLSYKRLVHVFVQTAIAHSRSTFAM